jgi:hypothetical protein
MSKNNKLVPVEPYDKSSTTTYISQVQTLGVNDIYEYSTIFLDSAEYEQGSKNRPKFQLRTPIQNVVGIKVVSATIPFSWYTVHTGNNTFTIVMKNTTSGVYTATTITLTQGSYTASEMATELQSKINTALGGSLMAVTFSAITGKFTFTYTFSAPNHFWGLWFSKYTTSPARMIGMLGTTVKNDTYAAGHETDATYINLAAIVSTTDVLTSPYVADLMDYQYIMLNGTLGGRLNQYVRTNGLSTPDPVVIAKIPVAGQRFQLMQYTDDDPQYYYEFGNQTLQHMEFYLSTGYGEDIIDFNGLAFQVKLGVLTEKLQRTVETSRNESGGTSLTKRQRML